MLLNETSSMSLWLGGNFTGHFRWKKTGTGRLEQYCYILSRNESGFQNLTWKKNCICMIKTGCKGKKLTKAEKTIWQFFLTKNGRVIGRKLGFL